MTLIYSSVTFWEETAPVKLPARYCLCTFFPCRLANAQLQMAISLSSPHQPKPMLQPLTTMLRMNSAGPIRSCSKAPGVFSSNYRYPASSPELHFHRASPRDSFPLITPFVHVGTYPTRNFAFRFHVLFTKDHILI